MDDFLKQMFPKDAERWIKVKYVDPDKAIKFIRFNNNGFNNDSLGIEILNIGVVEEYMPQVEALIELKAEIQKMGLMGTPSLDIENLVDNKIQQVLERTLVSKR